MITPALARSLPGLPAGFEDAPRGSLTLYMHAYITLIIPWERLQTQQGVQVRIEQALALPSLCMQSNAGTLSVINSGINCLHPFYNRQNIVITVEGCKIFQPVGSGCSSNRLHPSNRASPNSFEKHPFHHKCTLQYPHEIRQ